MFLKRLLFMALLVSMCAIGFTQPVTANSPTHSDIHSLQNFEVQQFEPIYDQTNRIDYPELTQYLHELLAKDGQLPIASHAEGVIRVSCQGFNCRKARLSVHEGENGPAIWHTETSIYRLGAWYPRSLRAVARGLMDQLNAHYQEVPSSARLSLD